MPSLPASRRCTFPKEERLRGLKTIEMLFKEGASFSAYPLRVLYQETDKDHHAPARILTAVPSRNFRLAAGRNRMKRLLREAYRTNKYLLLDALTGSDKHIIVAFIYQSKREEPYSLIQEKMVASLRKIAASL